MQPTIGRTVLYRSKTGTYTMPAIINATQDTLHLPNVEAGHVGRLSSETHVHLLVLTPGRPGHVSARTQQTNPELVDPQRSNAPLGGTFQEEDIPFWEPVGDEVTAWERRDYPVQPAGTWAWPPRV